MTWTDWKGKWNYMSHRPPTSIPLVFNAIPHPTSPDSHRSHMCWTGGPPLPTATVGRLLYISIPSLMSSHTLIETSHKCMGPGVGACGMSNAVPGVDISYRTPDLGLPRRWALSPSPPRFMLDSCCILALQRSKSAIFPSCV